MRIWQFKTLRCNPKLYNESTFGFPARKIICYSAVKKHGGKQVTFIWPWTEQVFGHNQI